ncbi:MAG: helix-turn-helix domain-containing protein [Bacillaceae bacterium]|nr:helix-turn-helix domain-containing protein [Bacillaceae bacterium]
MELTRETASLIINKIKGTLSHHINIMDEQGVVIASSDEKRIDTIHAGAVEVLKTKKPLIIYEKQVNTLAGTKPGVNLPIEFMEDVIGVVGVTGNPEDLLQLAQMTKMTVELMIQQNHMKNQAYFEQQLMHSWITELISPDLFNKEKLEKQAKYYLQLDVEKEYVVILIELPSLQTKNSLVDLWSFNELKNEILKKVQFLSKHIRFSGFTNEELLIVGVQAKSSTTEIHIAMETYRKLQNVNNKLFSNSFVGVGYKKVGVIGIRESYKEAYQSLSLMKKFVHPTNVSHIQEWGLIRLLDEISPNVRNEFFVQYKIAHLSSHLKETLVTLIQMNHSFRDTAEKLHIHRNTLNYRLDSIEQITGLHPKKINDLSLLHVLLILEKLKENT